MAKLDWRAGDTGTRTNMDRPFWISSGVVSGANIIAFISPGSVRYLDLPYVVGSGQMQSVTFGGAASQRYVVFVRWSGGFMVSGTDHATLVPGAPRVDAEPVGLIHVNGALSTANLRGPWNGGTFATVGNLEQRGEMIASTRPRAIMEHHNRAGDFNPTVVPSGISFLSFSNAAVYGANEGAPLPSITDGIALRATIVWTASGSLQDDGSTALYVTPAIQIARRDSSLGAVPVLIARQTYRFTVAQNPATALGTDLATQPITTCLDVVDTPLRAHTSPTILSSANVLIEGYQLLFGATTNQSSPSIQVRIREVTFTALPGFQATEPTEPT